MGHFLVKFRVFLKFSIIFFSHFFPFGNFWGSFWCLLVSHFQHFSTFTRFSLIFGNFWIYEKTSRRGGFPETRFFLCFWKSKKICVSKNIDFLKKQNFLFFCDFFKLVFLLKNHQKKTTFLHGVLSSKLVSFRHKIFYEDQKFDEIFFFTKKSFCRILTKTRFFSTPGGWFRKFSDFCPDSILAKMGGQR